MKKKPARPTTNMGTIPRGPRSTKRPGMSARPTRTSHMEHRYCRRRTELAAVADGPVERRDAHEVGEHVAQDRAEQVACEDARAECVVSLTKRSCRLRCAGSFAHRFAGGRTCSTSQTRSCTPSARLPNPGSVPRVGRRTLSPPLNASHSLRAPHSLHAPHSLRAPHSVREHIGTYRSEGSPFSSGRRACRTASTSGRGRARDGRGLSIGTRAPS